MITPENDRSRINHPETFDLSIHQQLKDLYADIGKTLNGADLNAINRLNELYEQHKDTIHRDVLREMRTSLEESLKNGFTITNESDYKTLQQSLLLLSKITNNPDIKLARSYRGFQKMALDSHEIK